MARIIRMALSITVAVLAIALDSSAAKQVATIEEAAQPGQLQGQDTSGESSQQRNGSSASATHQRTTISTEPLPSLSKDDSAKEVISAYQSYADILSKPYGIAAAILVFGGVLAGWIGFSRLSDIRKELLEAIDRDSANIRGQIEIRLAGIQQQIDPSLKAYREMERHVDDRLKDLSKKADELHSSANLRAMSADCYYLSVVIDIVMSLSQQDPKDTHETAIAVRSHIYAMSEHMLRTATQGAELTQKQPDQWAFFYLYQGSALARLANFELALGRCKDVITREGVALKTKARAYYNAACYEAAGKLADTRCYSN